jgi:hypothetical protein
VTDQFLPMPDLTCPCGRELKSAAELAHSVCNGCRKDAHRPVRKRPSRPDFEDVPIPGLEDWGIA